MDLWLISKNMINTKTNKYIAFQKKNPIINTILTSLVSIILGYLFSYFIEINPSIKRIEAINNKVLTKQDSSIKILTAINEKYTVKNIEGEDLKVGYSSLVKEDLVKVQGIDLERGEEIYLINYIGKYKPSVRLMVEEVIVDQTNKLNKEIKIYISKEALTLLGLEKELYKGIFTLKMKRVIK